MWDGHTDWATQGKNGISSDLSEIKKPTQRKEEICNILIYYPGREHIFMQTEQWGCER